MKEFCGNGINSCCQHSYKATTIANTSPMGVLQFLLTVFWCWGGAGASRCCEIDWKLSKTMPNPGHARSARNANLQAA
eukprot:10065969-Ditylum_brightwellii.AAC.1